jgi:ribokinase
MCVAYGGPPTHVPAFRVTAVDATAAGDVFCGALAVALVEHQPLEQAVRFASAAAAICVTRLGAQPSIPSRHEIERFLQETGDK